MIIYSTQTSSPGRLNVVSRLILNLPKSKHNKLLTTRWLVNALSVLCSKECYLKLLFACVLSVISLGVSCVHVHIHLLASRKTYFESLFNRLSSHVRSTLLAFNEVMLGLVRPLRSILVIYLIPLFVDYILFILDSHLHEWVGFHDPNNSFFLHLSCLNSDHFECLSMYTVKLPTPDLLETVNLVLFLKTKWSRVFIKSETLLAGISWSERN